MKKKMHEHVTVRFIPHPASFILSYKNVLLGEQSVSKAGGVGSNPTVLADRFVRCSCGLSGKGASLTKRIFAGSSPAGSTERRAVSYRLSAVSLSRRGVKPRRIKPTADS